MDIKSRIKAFRLQTAQRLLYDDNVCWFEIACALSRNAGSMALDRHLFLMDIENLNLTGLTTFYRSILNAWKVFKFSRELSSVQVLWLREEPLLCNPAIDVDLLKSMSLKEAMWNAGITKVGHLINKDGWLSAEDLALKINKKSVRMVQKLSNKVKDLFPPNCFFSSESLFEEEQISAFPEIKIAAASGAWLEVEGSLLTFKTPQLELFSDTSKKTLYILCVKVSHLKSIENHKDSKWMKSLG